MRINAEKAWIASHFVATEAMRYYLCGFYVEPVEQGAILVSTDGARMTVIHDPTATGVEESAIINLSKDLLKNLRKSTTIEISGAGVATAKGEVDQDIFIQAGDCRIDGIFPEWRKILPTNITNKTDMAFSSKKAREVYLSLRF